MWNFVPSKDDMRIFQQLPTWRMVMVQLEQRDAKDELTFESYCQEYDLLC